MELLLKPQASRGGVVWYTQTKDGKVVEPRRYADGSSQETIVDTIINAFTSGQNIVELIMPQGTGKTLVALNVAAHVADVFNKKVLYIVPSKPLQAQVGHYVKDKFKIGDLKPTILVGIASVPCPFEGIDSPKVCLRDPTACPIRNVPRATVNYVEVESGEKKVIGKIAGKEYFVYNLSFLNLVSYCELLKNKRLLPDYFDCSDFGNYNLLADKAPITEVGGVKYIECPAYAQLRPLIDEWIDEEFKRPGDDANLIIVNDVKLLFEILTGRFTLEGVGLIIFDEYDKTFLSNLPILQLEVPDVLMLRDYAYSLIDKVPDEKVKKELMRASTELDTVAKEMMTRLKSMQGEKEAIFMATFADLLISAANRLANIKVDLPESDTIVEDFIAKVKEFSKYSTSVQRVYVDASSGKMLLVGNLEESPLIKLMFNSGVRVLLLSATPIDGLFQLLRKYIRNKITVNRIRVRNPHYGVYYVAKVQAFSFSGKMYRRDEVYRQKALSFMVDSLYVARNIANKWKLPLVGLYIAKRYLFDLRRQFPDLPVDVASNRNMDLSKIIESNGEIHTTRGWRGLDAPRGAVVFMPKYPYPDLTDTKVKWMIKEWRDARQAGESPIDEQAHIQFVQGVTRGARAPDAPIILVTPDLNTLADFFQMVNRGEILFGGLLDKNGEVITTDPREAIRILIGPVAEEGAKIKEVEEIMEEAKQATQVETKPTEGQPVLAVPATETTKQAKPQEDKTVDISEILKPQVVVSQKVQDVKDRLTNLLGEPPLDYVKELPGPRNKAIDLYKLIKKLKREGRDIVQAIREGKT